MIEYLAKGCAPQLTGFSSLNSLKRFRRSSWRWGVSASRCAAELTPELAPPGGGPYPGGGAALSGGG